MAKKQVDVTLMRPVKLWRTTTWSCNICAFYGQPQTFRVRHLFEVPRCGIFFDSRIVSEAARTKALIYTRDLRIVKEALKRRVPFAAEIHGRQDPRELDLVLEAIDAKLCCGIVVITEALKRYLSQYDRRLEDYILVASDAVDPTRFDGTATQSGTLAIGYVGSLYPGKGMEIIAPLAHEIPELDIHVFGGNPRQVEVWKRRCGSSRNLHFHGYVKPSEISECFGKFDIGLLPNQPCVLMADGDDIGGYTSPMKLFEYMAARKLVVASDIPVIREVVRNRENGVLVNHADPRAWAAAIRGIARAPELRDKIVQQARHEAVTLYSYENRFERILHHLKRIAMELVDNASQ